MPFKKLLPVIFLLYCALNCFGQETIDKHNKIFDNLIERFTVLKDSQKVKNGLYQVFTRKDKLVVRGMYTMGKKTGTWHFYNKSGQLMQIYNYDEKRLQFEAKQYIGSNISYLIDKTITDKDTVTKPVKTGGRYFGYIPYLSLYKTPFSPFEYSINGAVAEVELLVSPLGRLADYKVTVVFPFINYTQTLKLDLHLFKEEDREFIPATFNHVPILSRIIIKCRLDDDGGLLFQYYDEF
ncbi:MAG: hypothetical protein ACXVJB_08855 [Mucilaginibacter sp.]